MKMTLQRRLTQLLRKIYPGLTNPSELFDDSKLHAPMRKSVNDNTCGLDAITHSANGFIYLTLADYITAMSKGTDAPSLDNLFKEALVNHNGIGFRTIMFAACIPNNLFLEKNYKFCFASIFYNCL